MPHPPVVEREAPVLAAQRLGLRKPAIAVNAHPLNQNGSRSGSFYLVGQWAASRFHGLAHRVKGEERFSIVYSAAGREVYATAASIHLVSHQAPPAITRLANPSIE